MDFREDIFELTMAYDFVGLKTEGYKILREYVKAKIEANENDNVVVFSYDKKKFESKMNKFLSTIRSGILKGMTPDQAVKKVYEDYQNVYQKKVG